MANERAGANDASKVLTCVSQCFFKQLLKSSGDQKDSNFPNSDLL